MLYTVPDYYKEFSCVADRCEDTCCAGWQIVADKRALRKYRRTRGSYLKKLLKNINWFQGTFRQDKEKRCAFLNEDNLCDMYIHLGSSSLCRTCRLYPRHIEEFEGVREISLSVSCPEVARILMNRTEPVTFLTVENEKEEEYEDFDPFLYSILADARDEMIQILQDRTMTTEVRAGLVYGMGRDMQNRLEKDEIFACQEVLEKYKKESARKYVEKQIDKNRHDRTSLFVFYQEQLKKLHKLELLKEDWYILLTETIDRLFENGVEEYILLTKEFDHWIEEQKFPWEIQKEQLFVYFIFTYFCGAVYDGQILDKVQMAIISVNILENMMIARWLRNEKQLYMDDVIELVYRYSREVEHSDINLKRMEQMMPIGHGLYC